MEFSNLNALNFLLLNNSVDYMKIAQVVIDENIPCTDTCNINNGGQQPQQGGGEGGLCQSKYEFCRPSYGTSQGECCEEWRLPGIDEQVFVRDQSDNCIRIASCGNGESVDATLYEKNTDYINPNEEEYVKISDNKLWQLH